jgi:hypothetical protein
MNYHQYGPVTNYANLSQSFRNQLVDAGMPQIPIWTSESGTALYFWLDANFQDHLFYCHTLSLTVSSRAVDGDEFCIGWSVSDVFRCCSIKAFTGDMTVYQCLLPAV